MEKLLLIDGNSLINRAFYATPPMSSKTGEPTNAVYAFVNMLIRLINVEKPQYMLIAFDRHEPTFRHKMYDNYKGTRKPMPDDLVPQVCTLKKVLDAMGISRYEEAGYEADDIIGTLAKRFSQQTYIVTGDKDSFQLVDDSTTVYFTKRGISDIDIYDNNNFKEKTGLEPKQIIDLKACMGDSSDNIPGMKGVGEKTALMLVQTYGSLENIYAHTEELKGKLKEKVEESKDIAFLSKTLATINTTEDIPVKIEDLTFEYPFNEATRRIFDDLEFRNLLKRDDIFKVQAVVSATTETAPDLNYVTVKTAEDFKSAYNSEKYAVVIGENFNIFDYNGSEYFIKIKDNFFDEGLIFDEAVDLLKPIFENEKNKLVLLCKKDLRHELKKYGVELKAFSEDVSIEKYLVDFSEKEETLDEIIYTYKLDGKFKAYSLSRLNEIFLKKLEDDNNTDLYRKIELPLSDVLFEMEENGFKIDSAALYEMSNSFKERINGLLKKIQEIAGEPINPNSSKQLGAILFEKLGLKTGKKTKTGFSTNSDVLEELEDSHEIIPLILKYRQLTKLQSTYLEGFKPLIDKKTGLVHTCFNQTLTTTGRLSSKEPNLQNIPVREEEGREIRKLFISSFENGLIVGADYSQIELRLLAHLSGCQPLIDAFNNGKDIHALTASQVMGVPLNEITPQMRRSAKAVNFGIIYGISDFGLSKQLNISPKEAGAYIKKYFEMYPSVKEFMESNVVFARENGYVQTIFGRKRYIREIKSPNFNLRSFGERAAKNMPLQGSSADIIKIAMINVADEIKKRKLRSKLILQVHDELLVDTVPEEKDVVAAILKDKMENVIKIKVPLTAEIESGKRWFDAK